MGSLPLTRQPDVLSFKSNIRASEGGGTTTLTSSDYRTQIFNLSSAQTCVLPTGTNIAAGDIWTIKKQDSTAKLTINCPSAASSTSPYIPSSTTICYLDSKFASAEFIALQGNPTTPDHWDMKFKYMEKVYLADRSGQTNDISYNSGNKATLSGTNMDSCARAILIPKQRYDGSWYLYIDIRCGTSSGAISFTLTILNTLFKNVSSYTQALSSYCNGGYNAGNSITNPNTATLTIYTDNVGSTAWATGGEAELDSKPTWAY